MLVAVRFRIKCKTCIKWLTPDDRIWIHIPRNKVYEPLTAFIFSPASKMRTGLPQVEGSVSHRNECL